MYLPQKTFRLVKKTKILTLKAEFLTIQVEFLTFGVEISRSLVKNSTPEVGFLTLVVKRFVKKTCHLVYWVKRCAFGVKGLIL